MSKKDLLERISNTPPGSKPAPTRRVEEPDVRQPAVDPKTTRVSQTVVRRRKEDAPPEPPVVVRRRAAVDFTTPPPVRTGDGTRPLTGDRGEGAPQGGRPGMAVDMRSDAARAADAAPRAAQGTPPATDAPAADPVPAGDPVAHAPVAAQDAPAPAERGDDRPDAAPPRGDDTPADAPAARQPDTGDDHGDADRDAAGRASQAEAARVTQADADQREANRRLPPSQRQVTQAPPPPRLPEPARPAAVQARPSDLPQAARFAGLGKAVVSPPPGYDPTNPSTWRREPTRPPQGPRHQQHQGPGGYPGQSRDHQGHGGGGYQGGPGGGYQNQNQGGYQGQNPGYQGQNPGYQGQNPGYQGQNPGYQGPGPGQPGGAPTGPDPRAGRRRVETSQEEAALARNRGRRSPSVPGRAGPVESPFRPGGSKRKPLQGRGAPQKTSTGPKAAKRKVRIDNLISVGQLAHELGVKAAVVIRQLMGLGKMSTITEMLDMDTAALVATEFDYEVENVGFQEGNYLPTAQKGVVEEEGLVARAPVVAVMGHVDHGKTTLLDAIRSARVAAGEAGGITQHIGAYQVEKRGQKITFLDTPGHEAFSAMRARGASVTDVVVLVVAADDGVQPQTEEAIAHAKAAGIPIVVAVNKMDKAGMNPDAIKQRLADKGLLAEDWGGDTMFVPVSALKQTGIDELLEAILLQAEVLNLRANPERHAEGTVIEAKMERGRGPVATVLIQKGTLHRGDFVVLGSAFGKVRAVVDYTGARLKDAPPSTPVELFGLSELPEVGDKMVVVENEKNARALAEHRATEKRGLSMTNTRRRTADDLFASANEAEIKRVLLVLKSDVQGSLEALKGALLNINVEGTEVRILHAAVGDISESDVNLAVGNDALLAGFNVGIDARARQAAQEQGVEPEFFSVIYDLLGRVERQLKGKLAPVFHSVRQGSVEVRQLFKISKVGTIAGCMVLDGKVGRAHTVKVLRAGKPVWEGKVSTLKRFKDDVRDVSAGYECGVALDGFDNLEVGDVLESYAQEQVVSA